MTVLQEKALTPRTELAGGQLGESPGRPCYPRRLPPDDEIGPWLRFLAVGGIQLSPGRLSRARARITVIDSLISWLYGVFSG